MESKSKESYTEPPSESEKHHFSPYEKRPHGDLLGQQSKDRTYFDSGDLALSAAHQVTNNGAIQTGKAHPHRESISSPYSPVPSTSNVDKDANEGLHRKMASLEKKGPLYQHTDIEYEAPTNKGEQGK
ncbi:hypothetical protein N7537_008420 [Penicillium hordei]|uniref:mRNA stability protein n=1 Tax=Penicillium hordei TaxID=40994 RepID=A0AAD6E1J3_9EURO|nr:uncharacterized protein N7537_008420 [Penicillium hordei]KAJ5598336.1 hypothetical protein N7537_008420 [Penicillium hordei]